MAITSIKTGSSFTNLIKYNDFLAGNTAFQPTAYESIATVTVGSGGSSSIDFTSIPSTYQHLQIRAIVKNTANNNEGIRFRCNSDTGSNYNWHRLFGDGSSASAYGEANSSHLIELSSSNSPQTNIFSTFVLDILDYKNTNKFKTARGLSGKDFNGSGNIFLASGAWRNTNAITSITIYPTQDSFAQYSKFGLFGIRGA